MSKADGGICGKEKEAILIIWKRGQQGNDNRNNPIDVTNVDMQQHNTGYGDYTKEKYEEPEIRLEELDALLKG